MNDGERFQDRKLNRCARCGTRKRLGTTFDADGKLYFLCENDMRALGWIIVAAKKVGIHL